MNTTAPSSNNFERGVNYAFSVAAGLYYLTSFAKPMSEHVPKFVAYGLVLVIPIIFGYTMSVLGRYRFSLRIINKRKEVKEKATELSAGADSYGIIIPLQNYKTKLDTILKDISSRPLEIDDELLVSLYSEGLANVKERFWTTTYLTSGFWAHGKTNVINANNKLLARLKSQESGDVRRIFLLRNKLSDETRLIGKRIEELKAASNGEEQIREMIDDFNHLRSICTNFTKNDCNIKYLHDPVDHSGIGIHRGKTEIALYDNFRVDYFEGAADPRIKSIRIYTENQPVFNDRSLELNGYFERLWDQAKDIKFLFEELDRTYKYYSEKIDYTYERLIIFDSDLSVVDKKLKDSEIAVILEYLVRNCYIEKLKNVLDIGTCTGRYPFILAQKAQNARVIGLDADQECINYCKIQKRIRSKSIDLRNTFFMKRDFLQEDIGESNFDLITCMLGTISHFGWNRNAQFQDDLQKALKKMSNLLSANGLLIISNWSEFGTTGNMLEIYNDSERDRLRRFTERTEVLIRRLRHYFVIVEQIRVAGDALEIIICKHNK